MTALLGIVLAAAGFAASFYAGFCLLGGPDGAILSRSSFLFGLPALLLAGLLLYGSTALLPGRGYVYAPLAVPVAAWLAAVLVSQTAGFWLWLAGTPAVVVVSTLAWIVSRYTAAQ